MLEIKFKIWDNHNKRICPINVDCYSISFHGDVWTISCGEFYDYTCYPFARLDDSRFKMLQYSGLKDKRGREIYESDILCVQTNDDPEDLEWEIVEVKFKNGCFWIGGNFNQPLYEITVNDKVDGEIIGNIFDSPELLK